VRFRGKLLGLVLGVSAVMALVLDLGAIRLLSAEVEHRSAERVQAETRLLADLVVAAGPSANLSALASEAGSARRTNPTLASPSTRRAK